jgi:hypothetical protein
MNDIILPGYTRISEIAGAFVNYSNIPPERLENARIRGENVHAQIKDYLHDIPSITEYEGYMKSFHKFWGTLINPKILMVEQRMYEEKLKVTGQMDLIIQDPILGKILIDWKCTYGVGKHWEIQAAGYAHLAEHGHPEGKQIQGHRIEHIIFVRLDKNGNDPETINYSKNGDLFQWAHAFYHKFLKDRKCYLDME